MKKTIVLLALLALFVAGCTTTIPQSKITDLKSDTMVGKEVKIAGEAIDWVFDNGGKGVMTVKDSTGAIQVSGRSSGIYGMPGEHKFDVVATGTVQKGFGGEPNVYYIDTQYDLRAIKVTERT